MSFLPGWDSLESVARVESGIGITILVLVALAVIAGCAAYACEYRRAALARGAERLTHPQLAAWDNDKNLSRLHTILAAAALAAVALFVVTGVLAQQYAGRKSELNVVAERSRADAARQELDRLTREPAEAKQEVAKLRDDLAKSQAAAQQADAGRQGELTKLRGDLAKSADDLAKTRAAAEQADAARVREISGLREQLAKAEKRIEDLNAQLTNRRLSEAEKQTLLAALKPFPGQKVSVASIAGDEDGRHYAEDLVGVFDAAGWDHNGDAGISTQTWDRDPIGLEVTLNESDARAGRIAPGVGSLINVVRKLGLVADNSVFMNGNIPAGEVQVRVGRKLRPSGAPTP